MATAVQQFCLRWNNHQPNFISVFTNLLSNECLVDVTLAAEGKQLQAHKVVLSACSSYFQALFTTNPCQHPIVILKDIKFSDLKIMVDFMYYGEVNVSQDQLPAILKTAETLKIKGLADMPEQLSLSKSTSLPSTDKCDSPSPISPSVLRRKRLRKSSTGSGSEQTSEDTPASGSGSTEIPHSPLKPDPDAEGPSPSNYGGSTGGGVLRQEPSTDSEQRDSSHSFEDTDYGSRHVSQEEPPESNIKWSCAEESRPGPGTQSAQPITPHGWTFTDSLSVASTRIGHGQYSAQHHNSPLAATSHLHHPPIAKAPRKRSVNPQQDENFIAALEAVRSGGLGFCKAAKIYGVNNRTLWLEYKKRGYPLMRPSPKTRTSTTDHQSDIFAFKSYSDGNSFQRIKLPGLIAEQPHQSGYEFGNGVDYTNPLFSYSTL